LDSRRVFISLVLLGTAACGGGGGSSPTAPSSTSTPAVTVTSLSASASTTIPIVGQTVTVTATANDSNGTSATISPTWTSSDTAVATVSASGSVTVLAAGTATLTAASGSHTGSVTITVRAVTSITATASITTISTGETATLTATAVYSDGASASADADWASSDSSVATVDTSGTVTGVAAGTATMTATYGGRSASVVITVQVGVTVTSISATIPDTTIAVGDTTTVTATVHYSDGSTGPINLWASSDPSVASVNTAGVVTGVAVGTATITASYGDQSASILVTVLPEPVTVASITASTSATTITVGETATVTATIVYSDGSTGPFNLWTSSNPSVATVIPAGTVTGVAVGTATMTATYGGQSASVVITVVAAPVTVTGVSVSASATTITIGETATLTASAVYSDGTSASADATWESSNPSVASVNTTGTVTGVAAGTASVTATYEGQSTSVVITVVAAPVTVTGISVSAVKTTIQVDETTLLTVTALYSDGTSYSYNLAGVCTPTTNVVAEKNSDCEVTGVGAGTVTYSFTAGGFSDSVVITVEPSGYTVVGWIGAWLTGGWVENAVVRIGNTATATTDAGGRFELELDQTGVYPVVVEASGKHTSESYIEVESWSTGAQRNVLPTNTSYFDLNFFDHVFRDKGSRGTRRWETKPTVEILTKEMECTATEDNEGETCVAFKATENAAPSWFETNLRTIVNTGFPELTNDADETSGITITTVNPAAGTAYVLNACATPNRIRVAYVTAGSSNFDEASSYAQGCAYSGGAFFGHDVHISWTQTPPMGTLRHEMAHTLGWGHPDGYDALPRDSIMEYRQEFTAWDRIVGRVAYERPPGSLSPDKDPAGSRINLEGLTSNQWTSNQYSNLWPLAMDQEAPLGPGTMLRGEVLHELPELIVSIDQLMNLTGWDPAMGPNPYQDSSAMLPGAFSGPLIIDLQR